MSHPHQFLRSAVLVAAVSMLAACGSSVKLDDGAPVEAGRAANILQASRMRTMKSSPFMTYCNAACVRSRKRRSAKLRGMSCT